MTIEAIIWDMGGVILRTADRTGRQKWETRLGLPAGELDRLVFESRPSQLASLGRGPVEHVWAHAVETLKLAPELAGQLEQDFWSGDQVDQPLVEYIRQLRPAYRTALLSNAWPTVRHMIEQEWRFAEAFDVVILSAEVGLVKPDPAIYQLALDQLGVAAEAAVFLDDFRENVAGARQVGLQAIQFRTTEQAISDLEALLAQT
ncbi:MAG TPA: HAD family phosphatase [Anaerolineales bacterium]